MSTITFIQLIVTLFVSVIRTTRLKRSGLAAEKVDG